MRTSAAPQGKMARMATPSSGTPPTEADFHPRRGCGAGLCRVWPSGSVAIALKVGERERDRIAEPELDFADAPAAAALGELVLRREGAGRSEEHTSELQSLMRSSYAVICLAKQRNHKPPH